MFLERFGCLQLAFFMPLDVRLRIVLQRGLVLLFADSDCREAVVGAIFAFDQESLGALNCLEEIRSVSNLIHRKINKSASVELRHQRPIVQSLIGWVSKLFLMVLSQLVKLERD